MICKCHANMSQVETNKATDTTGIYSSITTTARAHAYAASWYRTLSVLNTLFVMSVKAAGVVLTAYYARLSKEEQAEKEWITYALLGGYVILSIDRFFESAVYNPAQKQAIHSTESAILQHAAASPPPPPQLQPAGDQPQSRTTTLSATTPTTPTTEGGEPAVAGMRLIRSLPARAPRWAIDKAKRTTVACGDSTTTRLEKRPSFVIGL